ncbi:hypothetical protein DTO013F2_9443 [Penicillium roqueforti]|nr:hypothetical protein DTO013F2_9443 [Penicillium roqueforti]
MRPQTCFLPNGRTFTVTPVFGGVNFKFNDLHLSHDSALPPGWSIAISTYKTCDQDNDDASCQASEFTIPTLDHDYFYISAIIKPPNIDYKPAISPTRQIAKMIWVTLWWYFHEPEPGKGDWRVYIARDGIFKGQNLLQKLERMGLIASEDSIVGDDPIEMRDSFAWSKMFVSRRSFWQIDPRLSLITPVPASASLMSGSAPLSRASFTDGDNMRWIKDFGLAIEEETFSTAAGGPFMSRSHIPTYYHPPPTLFINSNGIQHPMRPKPPHQGEVFYVRYIPSVQQYLSFRVPFLPSSSSQGSSSNTPSISTIRQQFQNMSSDLGTLKKWMKGAGTNTGSTEARVPPDQTSQGACPPPYQNNEEEFLRAHLRSRHSFPAIGCWDGKPFGYFQIYWVKESRLGTRGEEVDNYDRGILHYCWLADIRTRAVMLELKMDREKIVDCLRESGLCEDDEVNILRQKPTVIKIKRDSWESPVL